MYDTTKPYKASILQAIEKTWDSGYVTVKRLPGMPYPVVENHCIPSTTIEHTDGIGTKGLIHWKHRTFEFAVQDALAMNLNDMAVARARPITVQNHIMLPNDDHDAILRLVVELAHQCKMREIAITGGETSIHNNLDGLEMSLSMTALVDEKELPSRNQFENGDVLIGLESNGLHSNGFTLVRSYIEGRRELAAPTRIYWDEVFPLLQVYNADIHAIVHIAGGGFCRLLDCLGDSQTAYIEQEKPVPSIFNELYGVIKHRYCLTKDDPNETMYTTFNCGVGMVLAVPVYKVEEIMSKLKGASIIGSISHSSVKCVRIVSVFNGQHLELGEK